MQNKKNTFASLLIATLTLFSFAASAGHTDAFAESFSGVEMNDGPAIQYQDSGYQAAQQPAASVQSRQPQQTVAEPEDSEPKCNDLNILSNFNDQEASYPTPLDETVRVVCENQTLSMTKEEFLRERAIVALMNQIAHDILNESGDGEVSSYDVDRAVDNNVSRYLSNFLGQKRRAPNFVDTKQLFFRLALTPAYADIVCDGTNCQKTMFEKISNGLKDFFRGLVGLEKAKNGSIYLIKGQAVKVSTYAVGSVVGTGLTFVCPAFKQVRTGVSFINFIQQIRRNRKIVREAPASIQFENRGQKECCKGVK